MNEKNPPISGYATQIVSSNRRFSDEFKRDAVRLIVDEQYTFKAAARAVGVSENSLRVQIERAKTLLATTDLATKQIATQSGFRESQYLSRAFRRITGQTPGQYRKHARAVVSG